MSRLLQWLDVQARFDRFGHDPGDAGLESYSRASLAISPAVFGAFISGRLAGIAEITRCAPDNAAILAFAVEADWRRKGIGCRLLLAALSMGRRLGSDARAIAMHAQIGIAADLLLRVDILAGM